jgi:ActR/RegA family two-component response regulator
LISVTPDAVEEPLVGSTPWVLLLVTDEEKRHRAHKAWETAGFAVEIVASAKDTLECLKVMTPSLVVVDDRLYRPAPR